MNRESDIAVKASFGHTIRNWFLTQEPQAECLAVLFPGGDGICDVPLLHYARKVALQLGCDVLSLEYGYVRTEHSLSRDFLATIIQETGEAVRACQPGKYERVCYISKSFGTLVAGAVREQLGHLPVRSLYLAPLEDTLAYLSKESCAVVMGDKDKHFPDVGKLSELPGVRLHVFRDAGHSLEIRDDYKRSLEMLGEVAEICERFIRGE